MVRLFTLVLGFLIGTSQLVSCVHPSYWVESISVVNPNELKIEFYSSSGKLDKVALLDGGIVPEESKANLRSYFHANIENTIETKSWDNNVTLKDGLYSVSFIIEDTTRSSEYLFVAYNGSDKHFSQVLLIELLLVDPDLWVE